jgi:hypothetical protein
MQQILTIEFGGIAEMLYSLSAVTNNDRWARTIDRFQKRSFINPLAARAATNCAACTSTRTFRRRSRVLEIKPGDNPLGFRTTVRRRMWIWRRSNSIFDRRYSVYGGCLS